MYAYGRGQWGILMIVMKKIQMVCKWYVNIISNFSKYLGKHKSMATSIVNFVVKAKVCSHITKFSPISYLKISARYSVNMGDEPILPVIQSITINTMLNNNGPNIGDGLNFVTCERSFTFLRF